MLAFKRENGAIFARLCFVCVFACRFSAVVVRNLLQPVLDVARTQAKMVTKRRSNNDKANMKGTVRLECAAASQFMRTWWWEAVITMCLDILSALGATQTGD